MTARQVCFTSLIYGGSFEEFESMTLCCSIGVPKSLPGPTLERTGKLSLFRGEFWGMSCLRFLLGSFAR